MTIPPTAPGHTVYLGTGTNLGQREANLRSAAILVELRLGRLLAVSGIYATEAWGLRDQPPFLNQVLVLATALSPEEVLQAALAIEQTMGRIRQEKWGTRLIDIDVLFYDDQIIQRPHLTIPHPYLAERNFVLAPLAELAPDLVHPVLGQSIAFLLANSPDPLQVQRLGE